jgi:predicted MFS family arabinose efflux permease
MGLLQGSAAGLFGAVIGPPVLIALAEAYGWRHAFIVSLLPGLLIAWFIWRYVRQDEPRRAQVSNARPSGNRLNLLKSRNIVLCTLISCVFLTWFVILISFTPTFLVSVRGYSAPSMGAIMSCLGAAWVVWGFVVPSISDRIGRRLTLALFSLIAACCPLALLYAPSPMVLGVLMVLTYTGLGCFTLFMSTIPAETVPREVMATALGMIMGIGELVGGFVAPTVAGFAADQFGLSIVMWISCGGALLAAGLSLLLKETAPTVLQRLSRAPSVAQGHSL